MEVSNIRLAEDLMQEYKMSYKVTYGGRNQEIINLEFDNYSLIYDESAEQYMVCNVNNMNFIFLENEWELQTFLLSVLESQIPEDKKQ